MLTDITLQLTTVINDPLVSTLRFVSSYKMDVSYKYFISGSSLQMNKLHVVGYNLNWF